MKMYGRKVLRVCICLQAQLQDAKRRWEELQNFIHSVNAEREKIQTSKQGDETQHCTKQKF